MITPLTSPDNSPTLPIAVIGLGCRLPGGIDSPQRFWEALLRGADFIDVVPADRWDVDSYYGPEPAAPGRSVSRWGGFIDSIGAFDADFFGMTESEAIAVDPQHRLLLETSWEAVEHAGIDPAALARSQTGVFVGLTHSDYELLSAECGAAEGPYGFTATSTGFASARVSQALRLHGPAVTVDTACSSGLMAVHQACRSLQVGESELALAGGVSVILEPRRSVAESQQGKLSPTGRCRAFDADADGFVAGEGSVVLLLKRLPEAIRDNNRILAVLRGSAANQDGGTGTAAAPSERAQVAVYQAALAAAGVEAATVELVEAHGLGNPAADLTEYAGLAAVYGTDYRCFVGSVKANFGHCQSASGPLGLMKAIMALQNGVVPQHLNFTRLPDRLAAIDTNLVVPLENMAWETKAGHPRRAAVSSHGQTGTNVHVIIEQAPEAATDSATEDQRPVPLLFPVSANSADQLRVTAARLADWVDDHGAAMTAAGLADLGYTLARRRSHRPVRTAVAASNFGELGEALREIAGSGRTYQPAIGPDSRGPVWVFSEQTPPWTSLAALLTEEPAFAAAIAKMEPIVAEESGFSLAETIAAELAPTDVERAQPTNFAIQVALAEAMKAHGVAPGAVIGHSLGEAAAAVVAGGLTLEDGLRVACRRSRLISRIAGGGAMATVELPAQQVLSEFSIRGVSEVGLAVAESPVSTIIGGDAATVRDLVAGWQQQGVSACESEVAVAVHSPQVEPVLDELAQALAELKPIEPEIPYYSATLWSPRDRPNFDGQYWADNLRYMARFAAAVQAAIKDGYRVFGELASQSRSAAVLEQNAASLDIPIAALVPIPGERQSGNGLRGFVADLYSAGTAVDFAAQYPSGNLVDAPLPSWHHRELIFRREDADAAPTGAAVRAVHPLLGAYVHLLEEPERHVWQGEVGIAAHPWLDDHRVHNLAVLPSAAYCEMALAAARASLGESAEIRDLRFEQMLPLDDWTPVSAGAVVVAPGVLDFGVHTHQGRDRVDCATAVLQAQPDVRQPAARDIAALLAAHQSRVYGVDLRKAAELTGIRYGPAFSGLVEVRVGDGGHTIGATALAEVELPGPARPQQGLYEVHPALLKACIMSAAMRPDVPRAGDGGLLRPVGVRRLRRHHLIRDARYCLSTVTAARADACEVDLELMDGSGTVLLTVEGLQLAAFRSEAESAERTLDERLLTIEWERRDHGAAESTAAGNWLLLSTADAIDPLVGRLAGLLNGEGAQCLTLSTPIGGGSVSGCVEGLLDGRTGVVVVTPPADDGSDLPQRGRDFVAYLLDVVQQMVTFPGESPRLYVVTRDAAAVRAGERPNLEQAGIRGLLRAVDSEYPHLKVTQIDVDSRAAEQDEALAGHLAAQLRSGADEDETAWRDGDWYTARLRPGPLGPADRRTTVIEHGRDCLRLQRSDPGEPESWEAVAHPRTAPSSGQIEVAVTVAGVNCVEASAVEPYRQQLGADFAGVVTAVGPDVTGHRVGDHVAGISPDGCWSTFITCDARLAATLPAELPLTEAAVWPTAYATAWYGLHDLARVTPADRVLVHCATGAVGQAAIAIARAAGCQIFATADTPQRRQLLRDMGIEHVYDSGNLEFADRIRRDTDGYGVDVVLNSLPGVAQRVGIELLSFGGRFIELGTQDVYGDSRLGLFPFRRNLSLHVVDLALLAHSHPETVQRLLGTVLRNAADGRLPQPRTTHHRLLDAADALRLADGDDCAATVLLDVPQTGSTVAAVPPAQARLYRADGSYIVTGGTDGAGLYLAAELAAAGCGRIVLHGDSAPDGHAQRAIERLCALGTDIAVECGDIAQPATAERLVAAATMSGLPVRGVLHAVPGVAEAPLAEITEPLIDRCWAPKVHGAWNLHQALLATAQPLDWFCAFSSTAALIGSPGHGAAAAADSWLDAFGRWRQAQGLPATVIGWGPWAGPGDSTESTDGPQAAITAAEAARAFHALLSYGRAYAGYAPITRAPWLAALGHRSPFAQAFRPVRRSSPDAQRFLAELQQLPRDEWVGSILRLISDQISLLLRRTVEPDRPLPEYGLDSLASLELRTRVETETGVRVGPAQLTTVRGLAQHVCDQLAARAEHADSPSGR